jgi:hypothetical protein
MAALVEGSRFGDFMAGLAIGTLIGLLLARAFWSWIAWREWRDASGEADRRTARLSDEVLQRMEEDLTRDNPPSAPSLRKTWPPPPRS